MNFNTKAVHRATGLTIRQIDYWDRSHFIKPSVSEANGTGSVRLYSFTDLVQLKVAKTLMEKGITLQKIRKAITYLKTNMPDVEKPLSELRFLTDGATIFVITRDDKQIVDTLKKGQLVFSIALGDLIEGLPWRGDRPGEGEKIHGHRQGQEAQGPSPCGHRGRRILDRMP